MNRSLTAALALMLCAGSLSAQQDSATSGQLAGRVLYQQTTAGVPYATVTLNPGNVSRFTDSTGAFAFVRLAPGIYKVRARQIGFTPFDTTVRVLLAPAITNITLRLRHVVRLSQVTVRAKAPRECTNPGVPDSTVDPALALLFSQMSENIVRMRILMTDYPFRYRRTDDFIERESGHADRRVESDTEEGQSWDDQNSRYATGEVQTSGTKHGQPAQFLRLVQFQDLTERSFEDNHCFHLVDDPSGLERIDFRPRSSLAEPDIEGSVYIDPEKFIVRHASFHLTRPRPPIHDWAYSSTFNEVVPFVPIVERFHAVSIAYYPGIHVDDGRFDSYSFIREAPVDPTVRDTLAGAGTAKTIVGQFQFGSDANRGCPMPPPQLVVEPLVGTILAAPDSASNPGWRTAARAVLSSILAHLQIPSTVDMATMGYPVPASVTDAAGRGALRIMPGVFGRYAVDLHRAGATQDVRVNSTSLSSDVDSAFVQAMRGVVSDRLRGETIVLAISTTPPPDTSLSTSFAHMQVPSWLMTRAATVPSAGTASGDTASFEFIVDDQGHTILSTVHRLGSPTELDPLTEAAQDSLSNRTYKPALVGRCPLSQVATEKFFFQR